jgi:hypothetical protein
MSKTRPSLKGAPDWISGGSEKEKQELAPALQNVVIYTDNYSTNYGKVKSDFWFWGLSCSALKKKNLRRIEKCF